MKIEERNITINQTVYIANDGTEFTDKYDCIDHETMILEKSLNCYDENFNKTNVGLCTYVNLITEDDVKNFKTISDHINSTHTGIDKPGLYMYKDDSLNGIWINLDDVMFHIRGGLTK